MSSYDDGLSSAVVVTHIANHTITLLKDDTGEVITRRQVEKSPKGVTTEIGGYIFVCYNWTTEVAVLSEDLSEEKIVLSERDGLSQEPQATVFDNVDQQLLVSNYSKSSNNVDCFQLL